MMEGALNASDNGEDSSDGENVDNEDEFEENEGYEYMDPDDPSLTDDERHEAVMMHAEDLIDTLYRLRQKHPDAVIDDVPIDDMIAKLEEGLVSMQKADEEYNALRNRVIEMRAQMIYSAETIVQHLSFSFAVWVGHWRPRSPFIHEYYDATDARTLLSRNRWRPYHHHN